MPVVTYEDLQPDITRIVNGDTSPILCALPISQFLTRSADYVLILIFSLIPICFLSFWVRNLFSFVYTSGTSGVERKLMPMIDEEFERRSLFYSLQMPIMDQYVPELNKGKGSYFMFVKSEAKTPGGLVSHPALTSYYKSSYFKEGTFDPFSLHGFLPKHVFSVTLWALPKQSSSSSRSSFCVSFSSGDMVSAKKLDRSLQ
ncbi:hypothetical protein MKX01_025076 [Papaver californicum]|nr:hypothetical protein MKX01_025076 [Papaver californicum]